MTIPIERTWSIKNTREFLLDLLDPKKTPKIPKEVRKRARRLLKHFPTDFDIERCAEGEEIFGKKCLRLLLSRKD